MTRREGARAVAGVAGVCLFNAGVARLQLWLAGGSFWVFFLADCAASLGLALVVVLLAYAIDG